MRKILLDWIGRHWLARELGISSLRLDQKERRIVDDIGQASSEAAQSLLCARFQESAQRVGKAEALQVGREMMLKVTESAELVRKDQESALEAMPLFWPELPCLSDQCRQRMFDEWLVVIQKIVEGHAPQVPERLHASQ